ncbi:MAG: hypothetical protein MUF70_05380 [Myxococcota bacterium]|nr:hypothetical protein [Myxococcota bacterium]
MGKCIRSLARGATLLGAIALLAASAHAAAPSDRKQVHTSFREFARAVAARDGAGGAALLSKASFAEWQRAREAAFTGERETVAALAPGRRLLVFALRHHRPPFLQRTGTPRELGVHAIESGLADGDSLARVELADVVVRGDRALGSLIVAGLPSSFRAGFVREDGVWKLDLPMTLDSASRVIAHAAEASGGTEDSVIAGLIYASSGVRPTTRIWVPMGEPAG